jgi:WhiB family redox-sensing transcriptional regulator
MSDWRQYAACRGVEPITFFPETTSGERAALAYCDRCPVRADCLEFALQTSANVDRFGIYGGTTPGDRRRLRRGHDAPKHDPIPIRWNPELTKYQVVR